MKRNFIIIMSIILCLFGSVALAESKLLDFQDESIADVVGTSDKLFIWIENGELYSYQLGDQEASLCASGYSCEDYGCLTMIENNLYIVDKSTGALVELMEQNNRHSVDGLRLPIEDDVTNGEDVWFPFCMKDTEYGLFLLMNIGYSDETVLCRYHWESETLSSVKIDALHAYCVCDDGSIYIVQRASDSRKLSLLDWKSGTLTYIAALPQAANGFVCLDGTLYFTEKTQVMKLNDALEPETVINMPITCGNKISSMIMEENALVNTFFSQVAIRSIDGSQTDNTTLTVLNDSAMNPGNGYAVFTGEHPEVEVKYVTMNGYPSTEEFCQELLTGELQYDVFRFRASFFDLETLARKGYLEDLTGDLTLLQAALSMYPGIADAVMYNDRLYAVPCCIYVKNTQYYEDNWIGAGLTDADIPGSYEEFLELMIQWDGGSPLDSNDNYYLLYLEPGQLRSYFVKELLEQYIALYTSHKMSVDFDTALFRELLDKCLEAADAYQNNNGSGYLLFNTGSTQIINKNTLALPLDTESSPVIITDVEVYVVNPVSTNKEAALAYIECCLASYTDEQRLQLYPDEQKLVLNDDYTKYISQFETQEAVLTQQLEAASDETARQQIQRDLDALIAQKEISAPPEYAISSEDIAFYQKNIAPYLFVPNSEMMNLVSYNTFAFETAIQQYLAGNVTQDQFIQKMNSVCNQIEKENE